MSQESTLGRNSGGGKGIGRLTELFAATYKGILIKNASDNHFGVE